jgi:uncharacterized membrane protein
MDLIVGGIFALVVIVSSYYGLDPRRWKSWLLGVYGFISGYYCGLYISNQTFGLLIGLLFIFIIMYSGAMSFYHRQRSRNKK